MNPALRGLRLVLAVLLLAAACWIGPRSIVQTLWLAWQARGWVALPATVLEHHSEPDEDGVMAVWVLYRYEFKDRPFVASRVGTGPEGADNVGDWQARWAERVAAAHAQGHPLTAWVDPSAPHRALLDRSVRWGLMGLQLVPALMLAAFGWVAGWARFQPAGSVRR